MTSTLRARWRVRKEPLQGPKDHRCDPNSINRVDSNVTRYHPEGIGPGETAYRVTVCPVCGKAWTKGMRDCFLVWLPHPRWRGRVRPKQEADRA